MKAQMYVTEKVVNGIKSGNSTTPCITIYGVEGGKRTVIAPTANRYHPVGVNVTIGDKNVVFVMRDHAVIWPKHQNPEGKKAFASLFGQLAQEPGVPADVELELVEVVLGGGTIKLKL